ncbi:MAG: hypothetical protein DHS20C21_17860 [Gemmatimonadota bacterium]|nr:MAG: hypothetical protein DHS20C21_17860 [Gemmatimonadota bacterium]
MIALPFSNLDQARRAWVRAAACVGVALVLPGCLATTKHVEMIESDMTRRSAWTDERMEGLEQEITQTRAENEALRLRMDDILQQLSALGGEVSTRITELEQTDRLVEDEVRQAAQQAAVVGQEQERDREDLLTRLNLVLEEVVKENAKLVDRIDALESSAFTFGNMHEVKPGESIASIAKKYGVTAAAIVEANGLSDANLIQVGQQLLVPGVSK